MAISAIVAVLSAPIAAPAAWLCTWGGSPQDAALAFSLSPGLRWEPAASPGQFVATGILDGEECPYRGQQMSFEGRLPVGSSCALFLNFGTVSGVPGIAGYFDTGHGASVGVLYGPTGGLAGTFQPLMPPAEAESAFHACAATGGYTGGKASVLVEFAASR